MFKTVALALHAIPTVGFAQNTFPQRPLASGEASARVCIARIGDGFISDLAAILAVPRLRIMGPCL